MSDNNDTKESLFNRYAAPPKLEVIKGGLEKKPYKAYGIDAPSNRPAAMLRVEYANGIVSLMARSFLTEIMCTSHQYLSLIFTNCSIQMEGERLDVILEVAYEERLLSLHTYHPNRYEAPAEEGLPIIKHMKREAWSDAVLRTPRPQLVPSTKDSEAEKGEP